MYSGNSLAPDKGNRGFIHWDVSFIGLTLNNCKLNHIFLNQRFWPLSYQTRMSGWLLKEVFNQNLILWNPLLSSKIFSETQVEQAGPQRRKKMGIAGAEAESLQIKNKRLYEWGEWGVLFTRPCSKLVQPNFYQYFWSPIWKYNVFVLLRVDNGQMQNKKAGLLPQMLIYSRRKESQYILLTSQQIKHIFGW